MIIYFLFSSELDGKTMGMVWKMMKAFGEKNKVHKNYIFYFEVSIYLEALIVIRNLIHNYVVHKYRKLFMQFDRTLLGLKL